jgi:DNA repair protein RecO (recombination protein O)
MLIKTRGVVLQHFKYSETSLVVKIFTEELGLQSYMVKGSRSKKSKLKPAYFQPLTLLEMVVYHKENRQLHSVKEIKSAYSWRHIPFNIQKQTVILFLNEILYKTLREEVPDKKLFEFIYNSLHWFDLEEENFVNFHIFFLLHLSRFLGFFPKETPGITNAVFFDLKEGFFTPGQPVHPYYIEGDVAKDMLFFLNRNIDSIKSFKYGTKRRRNLLDALVTYYQLHLPEMGKIKSLDILTAVIHG